jgi:hypothetical protein
MIVDFATPVGQVRLLISDIDEDQPIFADPAIETFIGLAAGNHVKRAAALALRTIAANEVLVQKRIRTLDLSTDGPAQAKELRALADDLERQADDEEVDGAFDWAEWVTSPAQFRNRIYQEAARGAG